MAVKKITRRWLFNSLGVILVILLAMVVFFSLGIRSYYYSNVQDKMVAKSLVVTALLEQYAQDSSLNFTMQVRSLVGNFEDKNRMELMALGSSGEVLVTSSGFEPEGPSIMPDYQDAITSSTGVGQYMGVINSEKVMAVSAATRITGENLSAVRLVVSLEKVDAQISILIFAVVLVSAAIIFFVVFSSSYFINSIVNPVSEVGQTARKIAQGNFDVRLQKQNDDEIGELCDIINYMAEELSNAERIKNDFISSVSHELRTPLTAIKGWGETMLADEGQSPNSEKGLQVILRESERLSIMVEELLDFSRMQSGRFKLMMEKMDLLAELGEAVLMYTERANREGMQLIYTEPEGFAPVMGDKDRLRQVFINIIDNAIKYSDPGDVITVEAAAQRDEVVIKIADTGCGIRQEDLPNIKNKFFKANPTRRGSGIGLAVADEIVLLHSGRLDIESEEGEGTIVTITLPLFEGRAEDMYFYEHELKEPPEDKN